MHTTIELNVAPKDIPDKTQVMVAFLPTGEIDLQALGIDATQATELRARLTSFAEDWDSPKMDVYDRYDDARTT